MRQAHAPKLAVNPTLSKEKARIWLVGVGRLAVGARLHLVSDDEATRHVRHLWQIVDAQRLRLVIEALGKLLRRLLSDQSLPVELFLLIVRPPADNALRSAKAGHTAKRGPPAQTSGEGEWRGVLMSALLDDPLLVAAGEHVITRKAHQIGVTLAAMAEKRP